MSSAEIEPGIERRIAPAALRLACFLLIIAAAPFLMKIGGGGDPKVGVKRTQTTDVDREIETLKAARPKVVFIGNSMLFTRIDKRQFRESSGLRNTFLSNGGAASAAWYLYLKNILIPSGLKPEMTFLFFRDKQLTYPEYHTGSFYRPYLQSLQLPSEPVVDLIMRSEESGGGVRRRVATGTRDLYGIVDQPRRVQQKVRNLALDITGFGATKDRRRAWSEERFSLDNLRPDIGTDMADIATRRVLGDQPELFDPDPEASYLPHILDLAREHGIRLCLYRVKRRVDVDEARSDFEVRDIADYMTELRALVESGGEGVVLIDETPTNVPVEFYADGDHIGKVERTGYTLLFWENVRHLFAAESSAP